MPSRRPGEGVKSEAGQLRGKHSGRGGRTNRSPAAELEALAITGTRAALDPELQSWIRNVIVPGLLDAYFEQVTRAPEKSGKRLASASDILQSSRASPNREFSEGICN